MNKNTNITRKIIGVALCWIGTFLFCYGIGRSIREIKNIDKFTEELKHCEFKPTV